MCRTISRILFPDAPCGERDDNHLSSLVITHKVKRLFPNAVRHRDTVLHQRKGFAVAPPLLLRKLSDGPYGHRNSSAFTLERLCSHLWALPWRGLPATCSPMRLATIGVVFGLSYPICIGSIVWYCTYNYTTFRCI